VSGAWVAVGVGAEVAVGAGVQSEVHLGECTVSAAAARKVMPTAMERLVWGYGDGSTLPVFETAVGKIGAVICWENYMPLMRMAMYSKGIELYCAPTVDDRERWGAAMRHIALEGRCFVLCVTKIGLACCSSMSSTKLTRSSRLYS